MKMCDKSSSVRVYTIIWDAAIGEDWVFEREPSNEHDRYAVASKNNGVTIGHLPQRILRSCSLFLRRGVVLRVNNHCVKLMIFYFFVVRKFHALNFRRVFTRRNFYYVNFFWINGTYISVAMHLQTVVEFTWYSQATNLAYT